MKKNTLYCRVWGDEVKALDCGDEAACWLSRYICKQDSGARLVYSPVRDKSPRSVKTNSALPWMTKEDGVITNQ